MAEQGERILVFVPMYNCAPQIGRTVAQFDADTQRLCSEILFVDNRSTDDTAEACERSVRERLTGVKVRIVRNRQNYSLGGSHKIAFDPAGECGEKNLPGL